MLRDKRLQGFGAEERTRLGEGKWQKNEDGERESRGGGVEGVQTDEEDGGLEMETQSCVERIRENCREVRVCIPTQNLRHEKWSEEQVE